MGYKFSSYVQGVRDTARELGTAIPDGMEEGDVEPLDAPDILEYLRGQVAALVMHCKSKKRRRRKMTASTSCYPMKAREGKMTMEYKLVIDHVGAAEVKVSGLLKDGWVLLGHPAVMANCVVQAMTRDPHEIDDLRENVRLLNQVMYAAKNHLYEPMGVHAGDSLANAIKAVESYREWASSRQGGRMSGVYLDESEAQRILQSLRYDLEASGGCDHSVGICSCEVVRQIDLFEDLIAGNHLTDREREQHEKKCEEQS